MTFVRRALPLLLVLGGATVAPGAVQAHCGAPQKLQTFTVRTEWSKNSYRVGEKAKVDVLVTRPGKDDPSGNGIPMPGEVPPQPVEGARITSFLSATVPLVGGIAESDGNGEATIRFEIEDHLKGPQTVFTRASIMRKSGLPNDCTDVVEEGEKNDDPAFKAKR